MLAVSVNSLIHNYGYLAVFLAVGVESLGVPLPGETTLIAAALYAGSTHRLSIVSIVAVAIAGAVVGDNIGYLIGRVGGYRLLRRYGRYVRVNESELKMGRYLFDRHGGKVVFLGRFVAVLRTYAAFLAGTNKMHWRRFLIFNAAGGVVWATLFGVGAYLLGTTINKVSTVVTIVGACVAGITILAFIIFTRRHMHALRERAEVYYPGSLDDPPHAGESAQELRQSDGD
jgi:membrane protein DedA with SNARE-associated domain